MTSINAMLLFIKKGNKIKNYYFCCQVHKKAN